MAKRPVKDPDQFSEAEAKRRFDLALKGASKTPAKKTPAKKK